MQLTSDDGFNGKRYANENTHKFSAGIHSRLESDAALPVPHCTSVHLFSYFSTMTDCGDKYLLLAAKKFTRTEMYNGKRRRRNISVVTET